MSRISKSRESRLAVAKGSEETANEYRVSFLGDTNVLKLVVITAKL
jgi:hypothetical protein